MKTCKEMASIWNVTERTVTTFCKTGKIPGAIRLERAGKFPMMQRNLWMEGFHLEDILKSLQN